MIFWHDSSRRIQILEKQPGSWSYLIFNLIRFPLTFFSFSKSHNWYGNTSFKLWSIDIEGIFFIFLGNLNLYVQIGSRFDLISKKRIRIRPYFKTRILGSTNRPEGVHANPLHASFVLANANYNNNSGNNSNVHNGHNNSQDVYNNNVHSNHRTNNNGYLDPWNQEREWIKSIVNSRKKYLYVFPKKK